jgi:hypothetical protein
MTPARNPKAIVGYGADKMGSRDSLVAEAIMRVRARPDDCFRGQAIARGRTPVEHSYVAEALVSRAARTRRKQSQDRTSASARSVKSRVRTVRASPTARKKRSPYAAHLIYEALMARLFRELGATLTHRAGRDSGLMVRGITSISSIATDRGLSDEPVTAAMWSRRRLSLSASRAMRRCRSAGWVWS